MALVVYGVLLATAGIPSGLIIIVRLFGGRGLSTLEIGVLVASLAATTVIAYVLARAITRPLEALVTRTREVATGGRASIRPPDVYGTGELATLSQSFLDLASRLMDRTEYMRSFAAHVSHELKSPLTSIRGSAELMRDEGASMTALQRQRFLDNIVADADRLTRLVGRLRELAQAEMPVSFGTTALEAVLPDLRAKFGGLKIIASGMAIELEIPGETLAIVLGHLAANAEEHSATRLDLVAGQDGDGKWMTISDNGSGISPGNRDKIFKPFFTTRRDSGGTGMGLDIVRAMLAAHNGYIAFVPTPLGTQFKITFPHRIR